MNKKTKIVATIGPSSSDKNVLRQLFESGLDVVRLNMSHGSYDEQMEKVNIVRELNTELGTNVAILLDTKGPEVRTGLFSEPKVLLEKGNTCIITTDDVVGNAEKFSVSYPGLAKDISVGDTILLDDGYVSVEVIKVENNDITCKINNSGYVKDRRGVNVPGVTLNFEFISDKDRSDIIWACENNFDFIAASFVRNSKDMDEIMEIIKSTSNTTIQVLPKIESQDGVNNFDEILLKSDGVMVARGDLGVEVPAEEVPVIQKEIIEKCNAAGKMVITATQMLESMQSNPRPTRAEVSDVFNAVMDGTDAVMLSGESAAGDYPVEAVQTQAIIAQRAETAFDYETYLSKKFKSLDNTVEQLVSYSVVSTADRLDNVKLIIALTKSGATAKSISRLKPKTSILAVTNSDEVVRSLALSYGVVSCKLSAQTTQELISEAISKAIDCNLVSKGDFVVVSAGMLQTEGTTDLMQIIEVK